MKSAKKRKKAKVHIHNNNNNNTNSDRLVYQMREVMHLLGISRSSFWRAVKNGQLIVRQLGGRTIILPEDLKRSLNRLPKGVHPRLKKKSRR